MCYYDLCENICIYKLIQFIVFMVNYNISENKKISLDLSMKLIGCTVGYLAGQLGGELLDYIYAVNEYAFMLLENLPLTDLIGDVGSLLGLIEIGIALTNSGIETKINGCGYDAFLNIGDTDTYRDEFISELNIY